LDHKVEGWVRSESWGGVKICGDEVCGLNPIQDGG